MNPVYTIMESRYRWAILAGLSFLVTICGGIMMLAYGWSHVVVRVWLWLGIALTLGLLAFAGRDWWNEA
jgi:hypothetical protein